MKILIVSSSDVKGGAARAALRLHNAFLSSNLNSHFLCQHKASDNKNVIQRSSFFSRLIDMFRPKLDVLFARILYRHTSHIFSSAILSNKWLVDEINRISPDVVNLHWVNGGMFSLADILKIKAPIVWTLHDNWLLTGGCHVFRECDKYISKCGNCPILQSSEDNDLSAKNLVRKKLFLSELNRINRLHLICLSQWLYRSSERASITRGIKKSVIGNPIDTTIFFNTSKAIAKTKLGVKPNKLVIFGALSPTDDSNKGFKYLVEALSLVKSDFSLGVFGDSSFAYDEFFDFPVINFGRINDDQAMASIYSAADVVLVPSEQENLSNIIMESMSCSTPVVAFDIGGNSDLIKHKKNGFLATPFCVTSFSSGIDWIISDQGCQDQDPREHIITNFNQNKITEKYIDVFNSIIIDNLNAGDEKPI
jgi:glycosyltransferase involved in cell wall biosynthesis